MLNLRRILCSALSRRALPAAMALTALAACGQKGDLFLPTDPAAANRATLPQVLSPVGVTSPAPPAQTRDAGGGQGTGTAAPVRQP
jgi:predicted small lipoprotein YifL